MCMYNWITLLCTWNIVHQLYFNKIYILRKIKFKKWKSWLKLNIKNTNIMASDSITSWQINVGKVETLPDFISLGSKITADGDCNHEIKRCLLLGRKTMTNLDNIVKSRDITLPKKDPFSQSYGFSSSHVWMWELNHKEPWMPKNWCFWIVVLEKTPVNPKGNKPWIFIGRTDAEGEAPVLWPPDAKSWLTGKDPNAGKEDWGQEKGAIADELVGWHHQLNRHEFEQTPGDREAWSAAVHGVTESATT